jgi:Flp pilus assembly protein TadD
VIVTERHLELLAEHARLQLARGDVAGAVESLRRALSEDPDDPVLHALLAATLLAARRRHAARHEAERAVALAPELPLAHRALGYVKLAFRDLAGAAEGFERAAELAPEDPDAHLALGRLHAAAGRRGPARLAFERALALEPGELDAEVELGDLDLAEGKVAAARARALAVLSALAEHEGGLELMGRVLLAEGRADEARELALAILRQDATSAAGVRLLCAAKARRSLLLGLWWRWNAFMSSLGDGRTVLVLVGLYVAQRLAITALKDAGALGAAGVVSWVWIAFALYTWIGPGLFARSVAKELRAVRLRPDF